MLAIGFLLVVEATTLSRSGLLGLGVGALVLLVPYRRYLRTPQLLVPIGAALASCSAIVLSRPQLLHDGAQVARADERRLGERALPGLLLHPARAARRSAVRARAEHVLGLLRVRHRQDELGPALVLRRADRRDGARRHRCSSRSSSFWVFARLHAARALGRALAAARDPLAARVRPLAWGCTAALAGTLASNAFYLTMQFYYFYAFMALALSIPVVFAAQRVKVVVLTTSYPRDERDVAGSFVATRPCAACASAASTSRSSRPPTFRALRDRLRRRDRAEPARRAVEARARARLPGRRTRAPRARPRATPTSCTRTGSRRRSRRCATGKPYVLQVWGTDVELARRAPVLARPLVRARAAVIAASSFLAGRGACARRARGARDPARRRAPGRTSASRTSRRTCSSPGG